MICLFVCVVCVLCVVAFSFVLFVVWGCLFWGFRFFVLYDVCVCAFFVRIAVSRFAFIFHIMFVALRL